MAFADDMVLIDHEEKEVTVSKNFFFFLIVCKQELWRKGFQSNLAIKEYMNCKFHDRCVDKMVKTENNLLS